MGYYCTVPQCTSLAGKTKNVKFHRFPRDDTLAHKWNEILHRNKPFTKYSKVCSLHFTQADYNVTSMGKKSGQWKTLSKDAIPSQNLPKLNSDGTVMVIRKSRSLKPKLDYIVKKENEENTSEKHGEWAIASNSSSYSSSPGSTTVPAIFNTSDTIRVNVSQSSIDEPQSFPTQKITKHDAIMQTDPLDTASVDQPEQLNQGDTHSREDYPEINLEYPNQYEKQPKNYSKEMLEEYNKMSQSFALDRNKHSPYNQKSPSYTQDFYKEKTPETQYYKTPIEYVQKESFDRASSESQENYSEVYPKEYFDPVEILRNQQHNLQMLHEQMSNERMEERFYVGRIKEETNNEEEAFSYDTHKENEYTAQLLQQQRLMDMYERRTQIKSDPDRTQNCDTVMQNQQVTLPEYYRSNQNEASVPNVSVAYFNRRSEEPDQPPCQQPGAEMLKAKQNALAATLWQNSLKRPFYYSETPHSQINNTVLHNRYEEINRLMNP